MPTVAEIRAELERRKQVAAPPAAPSGNRPDPEAIKAELARRGAGGQPSFFQRQGQRMVSMGTPQTQTPVPVATAQSAASKLFTDRDEMLRRERREAARAFGGGMDMMPTVDAGGNVVPGTDVDRDIGKGIARNVSGVEPINAASRAIEGVINLPGDALQSMMGGQRVIPKADVPEVPIPKEFESLTGDLTGAVWQYALARGLIGKAAPGGGLAGYAGKDAATLMTAFDADTPRLSETLAADFMRDNGMGWIAERDPNNPMVERLKNAFEELVLSYAPAKALEVTPRVVDTLTGVGRPAQTPTNAGGAAPRRPVQQPPGAGAPQPSIAPIPQPAVGQPPGRGAQAGTAGAGQGGPATLQATPQPVNPAVAQDTQTILRRLLIDSNVPRNDVDRLLGELTNDYQVFQSSGSPIASRVGFGEFADQNVRQTANRLGMNMTPDVERQIQTALRGRGRSAHGSEGGSKQDRQPSIMSQYIEDMRSTQKDWAREQIEAPNAFNKSDIAVQRDAMGATAEDIGRNVYKNALAEAKDMWSGAVPMSATEKAALDKLQNYLLRKPYLNNVPDYVKLRLAVDDVPLEDAIAADPAGMAHRIQSVLGKAASEANDPAMRGALGEARDRLLTELDAAVPAYRRARADYGDEFATMRAFDFGRPFFAESRRPVDVADMKADYAKMTTRQKTAARMSVRDEIFGVFGMNAEDAAVRLEVLTRENTLNALEEVFGAPGKRVADTLRRLKEESAWLSGDKTRGLAGVDIYSGSPTVPNMKVLERDAASVRTGFQRAIAKAGDVSKFLFAIPADIALFVGTGGGYHLPMLTMGAAGGKITKGLSNVSPKKLSNATEGLFSLPKGTAAPPAPPAPRVRGPRGPRTPAPPLPTDRRALLEAYAAAPTKRERERIRRALEALGDSVPAPPAPRTPPVRGGFSPTPAATGGAIGSGVGYVANPADANQDGVIDDADRGLNALGGLVSGVVGGGVAGKAMRGRAMRGRGGAPTRGRPEQGGFGGRPALDEARAKPPSRPIARTVAGGAIGGMAGSMAGDAEAQSTETTSQLNAVNERIKQLEADTQIFETGSILQIQQLLQRRGKAIAADGKMGPQTAAAIQKDRDETRAELDAARKRRKDLEKQAANEATRPNDAQKALREWGPILGALAGLGLGAKLRGGAVKKAAKDAPAQIAKANALLTPGPLNKSRSVAAQAALKKQPANLNEFWQLGGAKDQVPFEVTAGGKYKGRKKTDVMPPSKLFPNRRIRSMDVGVVAGGMLEGVGAQYAASALEGQIKEARILAENEPTKANLAHVEALEDQHAIAVLMSRLGYGVAGGRLIASLKTPYRDARPDVAAADAERALLLEYLKKVK